MSIFEPIPERMKVKNEIKFEGIITDIDNSGELHGFGIERVKITKSNTKIFNAFQNGKVYPFNINGDEGEIYDYTLKDYIGCKVYVDPKNGKFKYYKNNKFFSDGDLVFIVEKSFIKFIKKKTRLNK